MGLVLLTGVGRPGQVGEAVARAFAGRGDSLVLVDHDAAAVADRAADLRAAGHSAAHFSCDLSDAAAVGRLRQELRGRFEAPLDAAVLMAGGFASGPVADGDPAQLDRMLSINLRTAFNSARLVIPWLRETRGAVTFFASEAVLPEVSPAGMAAYAAAKAGVVALMRATADEERPNGVRANAVAPATIRTAENEEAMGSQVPYVEREDVASVLLFLSSPAASAISGQLIRLR